MPVADVQIPSFGPSISFAVRKRRAAIEIGAASDRKAVDCCDEAQDLAASRAGLACCGNAKEPSNHQSRASAVNGGLRGRAFPRGNASRHSRLLSSVRCLRLRCGWCGTRLNYVSGKAACRLSGVSDEGERCRKQKQRRERGCALCDSQHHHVSSRRCSRRS